MASLSLKPVLAMKVKSLLGKSLEKGALQMTDWLQLRPLETGNDWLR